jgi:hypothetical protein
MLHLRMFGPAEAQCGPGDAVRGSSNPGKLRRLAA